MALDVIEELRRALGANGLLTGDEVGARASGFFDPSPLRALALARPATTDEVARVLQICSQREQTVVPVGGLTNLVESALTTQKDVALSLERMNAIEELDPVGRTVLVQAGATLQQVQEAAEKERLFFPLDLAARGSATIGGNLATNAGGVRVLRYGMMRNLVLGLEVVLADGTILSSLNRMLKNNSGYDLKQLFIGSEGTLGIITRAVLRLFSQPRSVVTALGAAERFQDVVRLLALAEGELGAALASYEVMWSEYYRLTTTPPAPSADPFPEPHAFYALVETLGEDQAHEQARMEEFLALAAEEGLAADAVLAQNRGQRDALWRIREDSDQIERQHSPTFGFDVSLPIREMEPYVERVRQGLSRLPGQTKCWIYGHLADGNLHLSVWGDQLSLENRARVEETVYRPLAAIGGSISAEHGVGLEKKAYLQLSRTPAEIALMRRLKAALDPQGILNPGKIFD